MLCRLSDYRTVASDPGFDILSTQVDVSQTGTQMVVGFTFHPNYDYSDQFDGIAYANGIYVLAGWQCKTVMEYQFLGYWIEQVVLHKKEEVCVNAVYSVLTRRYEGNEKDIYLMTAVYHAVEGPRHEFETVKP